MFWIKPRKLWGDYGDILFHGDAYDAREGDIAPAGVTVLKLCSPHSDILLPAGLLLCTSEVVNLLKPDKITVAVEEVWVECKVEVPIERWLKRGEPKYPRGGEPESYFQQFDMDRDFESGFGNDIFRIPHDSSVPILKAAWSRENPYPPPKVEGPWPVNSHLVLGKVTPHSNFGPLFCSKVFAEILTGIKCDNFELVEICEFTVPNDEPT